MKKSRKYVGESLLMGHFFSLLITIAYSSWEFFQSVYYAGSWYASNCVLCMIISLFMAAAVAFIIANSNPPKSKPEEEMTLIPAVICPLFTISILHGLEDFTLRGISAFGIIPLILLIAIIVCYIVAFAGDDDPESADNPTQKSESKYTELCAISTGKESNPAEQ